MNPGTIIPGDRPSADVDLEGAAELVERIQESRSSACFGEAQLFKEAAAEAASHVVTMPDGEAREWTATGFIAGYRKAARRYRDSQNGKADRSDP